MHWISFLDSHCFLGVQSTRVLSCLLGENHFLRSFTRLYLSIHNTYFVELLVCKLTGAYQNGMSLLSQLCVGNFLSPFRPLFTLSGKESTRGSATISRTVMWWACSSGGSCLSEKQRILQRILRDEGDEQTAKILLLLRQIMAPSLHRCYR